MTGPNPRPPAHQKSRSEIETSLSGCPRPYCSRRLTKNLARRLKRTRSGSRPRRLGRPAHQKSRSEIETRSYSQQSTSTEGRRLTKNLARRLKRHQTSRAKPNRCRPAHQKSRSEIETYKAWASAALNVLAGSPKISLGD